MKGCRRAIAAALVGGALAACAPVAPPAPTAAAPTQDATAVTVREHLSGRYLALIGPKAQHDPPFHDVPETNFFCLRSFIDRESGETAHQVYVAASYDAERDWTAAHDGAGRELRFVPISRFKIACNGAGNCSYAEEFAAAIPESELFENPRGFSVTFTDRRGATQTVAISPQQIAAQLAALAAHRKTAGSASPGSAASAEAAHQP